MCYICYQTVEAANRGTEAVESATSSASDSSYEGVETAGESFLAGIAPGIGAGFIASFLMLTLAVYSSLTVGLKLMDNYFH